MKVKAKYQIELACSTDATRPVLVNPYLHDGSKPFGVLMPGRGVRDE